MVVTVVGLVVSAHYALILAIGNNATGVSSSGTAKAAPEAGAALIRSQTTRLMKILLL